MKDFYVEALGEYASVCRDEGSRPPVTGCGKPTRHDADSHPISLVTVSPPSRRYPEVVTRILHLNDCAFVGQHLTNAAVDAGLPWRILPPHLTWPPVPAGRSRPSRLGSARTIARIARNTAWADVVHVHYATTARRLRARVVPPRPYVLHLHGTDIRTLWADPTRHAVIQSHIDQAAHVLYSTLDNEENARTARADAEYLPVFVDPLQLPQWAPEGYVAFTSRWEGVKGLEKMLSVAEQLVRAGVDVRGLDWGPGAKTARELGVTLVPKMSHPEFLAFLSRASVVVGQATRILSVSELEAMAIGVPLAAVGDHLPGPNGSPIPIRSGTVAEVAESVLSDLSEPTSASRELGSRDWTLQNHTAARYLPRLEAIYKAVRTAR